LIAAVEAMLLRHLPSGDRLRSIEIFRKFFSVANRADAIHRFAMLLSRQRQTLRVRIRTPWVRVFWSELDKRCRPHLKPTNKSIKVSLKSVDVQRNSVDVSIVSESGKVDV
jgi:hypothetical protein